MARNFNWDYRTAHPYGASSVSTARPVPPFFREELERPARSASIASCDEKQQFFAKNPHLLTNIHA